MVAVVGAVVLPAVVGTGGCGAGAGVVGRVCRCRRDRRRPAARRRPPPPAGPRPRRPRGSRAGSGGSPAPGRSAGGCRRCPPRSPAEPARAASPPGVPGGSGTTVGTGAGVGSGAAVGHRRRRRRASEPARAPGATRTGPARRRPARRRPARSPESPPARAGAARPPRAPAGAARWRARRRARSRAGRARWRPPPRGRAPAPAWDRARARPHRRGRHHRRPVGRRPAAEAPPPLAPGDPGEDHPNLAGGRPAGRVLGEQAQDHVRQIARPLDPSGLAVDHRRRRRQRGTRLERRPALHREVEQGAERPQVGGRPDLRSGRLLGRHVRRRPDDQAGGGHPGVVPDRGHPEVGQLAPVARLDQHVGRLDVAVHHPDHVGGLERGEHVEPDAGRPLVGERALVDHELGQAGRLDQLHDQPDRPVLLDHVVDRDHAGVVEPGRGLRLAQGPGPHPLGVLLPGQELDLLDRDLPLQPGVDGPEDGRPPPAQGAASE